ncbi:hypothetical protein BOS5A_10488 [Bosea sp. EC-HK365B]|nr:hypothetical protein BOSE21B_10585 [Bosea sp. 21B]CAD5265382.1 hypothetical protein BOSE7B_150552 [Bosea sp. 7B]VVT44487.1 hypothetical protein BOS5A_10488 [Bosea sp. EC-HK365B]VXC46414.1 hypothetical protein BOSE127_190179 [Bosea sp. 127]
MVDALERVTKKTNAGGAIRLRFCMSKQRNVERAF